MLINSAQKMPSIERMISIEFINLGHQLSAIILDRFTCGDDGCMTDAPGKSTLTTLCTDTCTAGVCYDCPHFAVCILCLCSKQTVY